MSRVEYQEHDRKRINERGNKRKRDSESEHARIPHATPSLASRSETAVNRLGNLLLS